ncbi:hypothetical protein F9948_04810 [Burkholderia thailandensis]|nr:hypothetical protein A8H32_28250 [Burkholderia thailandensis]MDD1479685.1 hypothetical protein [Burkholderia thailandensis]MDD1485017.1 hypothetical protein [Burkholderia thailandensis]MDD1491726.1 hypothetical protein [Burkholderia thailandensis]PJO71675.1 hypothetical protein CWD92_14215 [Burkholderia thailandensis]
MTTPSRSARCNHVAPPIAERLRLHFERAAGGGPSESAAARASRGRAAARTELRANCARARPARAVETVQSRAARSASMMRCRLGLKNLARLHIHIYFLRETVNMRH